MDALRLIIISGLSGAGKSTALHALEDIGYFCIDNLPIPLLADLASSMQRAGKNQIAVVIDVREGELLDQFPAMFERLKNAGYHVDVLFLDAPDAVLLQRFSETRRRHPLQAKDLREGIFQERGMLSVVRDQSRVTMNTAALSPQNLRTMVQEQYGKNIRKLKITVLSFGYKKGVPTDANVVFDVRFLANPYFVDHLSPLNGLQEQVRDFVLLQPEAQEFIRRMVSFLEFYLPLAEREGKSYVTIAVGCTGGQHRSVAVVTEICKRLQLCYEVVVRHRELFGSAAG